MGPNDPVEISFVLRGDIIRDIERVQNTVRGLGSESNTVVDQLNESLNRTTMQMNEAAQLGRRDFDVMSAGSNAFGRDIAAVGMHVEAVTRALNETGQTAQQAFDRTITGANNTVRSVEAANQALHEEREALNELNTTGANTTHNLQTGLEGARMGTNRLGFSVQQIVRELPAASMGINMLFLAVSNNIPILADEIQRAKAEVIALREAGQTATPVWKQLLSSVFSWQSAMMIGVTLLTVFGNKLFGATEQTESLKKRQEELVKSYRDVYKEAAKNRAEIDLTIQTLKEFNGTKSEEKRLVNELNSKYGDSFGHYKTLAKWYDVLKDKSADYVKSLVIQAQIQQHVAKATEFALSESTIPKDQELTPEVKAEMAKRGIKAPTGLGAGLKSYSAKKYAEEMKAANDLQLQLIQLQNSSGLKLLGKDDKSISEHKKKIYDAKKEIQQLLLDIDAETAKQQIAQMDDTLQKRLAKIDDDKNEEIRKIKEKNDDIIKAYNDNRGLKGDKAVTDITQIKDEKGNPIQAALDQQASIARLDAAYAARKIFEEKKAAKEVQEIRDELAAKNKDALDQELADIDKHYDEVIEKAKKNGEDISQIANDTREMSKANAIGKSKLNNISTDEDIAKKRQEIANRTYLFQADKEKQLLLITKLYAEKRLAVLKQMQAGGVKGLEGQIAGLETEVKSTTESISKTPWNKLSEAAGYAEQLGQAFQGVNADLANTLTEIGNVAGGIAQMASGNYIGGGITLLTEALKLFDTSESSIPQWQEDEVANMTTQFEKLNDSIKRLGVALDSSLGEKKMSEYVRNMSNLITSSQSELSSLLSLLKHYVGMTWSGADKYKDVTKLIVENSKILSDINKVSTDNLDIESINKYSDGIQIALDNLYALKATGLLNDTEKKALEDTISNLESQADTFKQIADQYKETFTGTTSTSITDSIVEGFKNGYSSAEDFADNFGSLMQTAVLQALKTKMLDSQMQDWYDQFAAANESDGVLTKDEISALKIYYNKIITDAKSEFDAMKQATGVDFTSSSTTQKADINSITSVTEDTASKLEGHFVAVRVNTGKLVDIAEASKSYLYKSQMSLAAIEKNTNELYRLEVMENVLRRIENDGIKLKN